LVKEERTKPHAYSAIRNLVPEELGSNEQVLLHYVHEKREEMWLR
jgi:hypothetical protein